MQNYVPDIAKNVNVRAFNRMSRTNETRHSEWHEMCEYKYRLDANVCNYKQSGMMINAYVKARNLLIKVYVIKDLFGILVIVSVNVINHVMLVNV